ncbi:MAG: hypothetical protein WCL04_04080 [Verrucomicrobiota bacterium]
MPGKPPEAATLKAAVTAHFQEQPLDLAAEATLTGPNTTATLSLAAVNPSHFRLKLPGDPPLAALDVPVRVVAIVRAASDGKLQGATLRLEGGPGLFHATKEVFNADVPVTSLTLAATADGATLRNFSISTLALDLGGIRLGLGWGKLALAEPGAVSRASGTLILENVTVTHALALWPVDLQPSLRRQIAPVLRDGALTRATFTFSLPFDVAKPAATRADELKGSIRLAGLVAAPPQAPGPVTLQELVTSVEWPGATIIVTGLAAPGVTLPNTTVRIGHLDQAEPSVEAETDWTADFSTASAWLASLGLALPPGVPLDLARLAGKATGKIQAQLPLVVPLDPARIRAEVTVGIASPVIPLTLPGHELGQGELGLTATASQGMYAAQVTWKNLRLTIPGALTGPVDFSALFAMTPATDELTAKIIVDAARARLLLAGDAALPPLAPLTLDAKITGCLE